MEILLALVSFLVGLALGPLGALLEVDWVRRQARGARRPYSLALWE